MKKLNPSLGWTELIKAAASNGHECFEVNLVIMVASALAILFRKWTMRKTRRREARRGEQLLATERKWIQSVHIIASSKSPITRARRRRGTTSMYPPYMVNSLAASVVKKYRRSGALCAVRNNDSSYLRIPGSRDQWKSSGRQSGRPQDCHTGNLGC